MTHNHNPFGNYEWKGVKAAEEEENRTPTGTRPEIMAWVGEDKERAQRALDAENANDKPRKTLVADLEALLG